MASPKFSARPKLLHFTRKRMYGSYMKTQKSRRRILSAIKLRLAYLSINIESIARREFNGRIIFAECDYCDFISLPKHAF